VKVSFLTRDRERTVLMYITDICQNDRNEKLYKKKVTRQERNFHCIIVTKNRVFCDVDSEKIIIMMISQNLKGSIFGPAWSLKI